MEATERSGLLSSSASLEPGVADASSKVKKKKKKKKMKKKLRGYSSDSSSGGSPSSPPRPVPPFLHTFVLFLLVLDTCACLLLSSLHAYTALHADLPYMEAALVCLQCVALLGIAGAGWREGWVDGWVVRGGTEAYIGLVSLYLPVPERPAALKVTKMVGGCVMLGVGTLFFLMGAVCLRGVWVRGVCASEKLTASRYISSQ